MRVGSWSGVDYDLVGGAIAGGVLAQKAISSFDKSQEDRSRMSSPAGSFSNPIHITMQEVRGSRSMTVGTESTGSLDTMTRAPVGVATHLCSEDMESLIPHLRLAVNQVPMEKLDALLQVWMPRVSDGTVTLSTKHMPFVNKMDGVAVLGEQLANFRGMTSDITFPAAGGGNPGLLGRVWLTQLPEWSPNVCHFTATEYPMLHAAQQCHVKSTLVVPVFTLSRPTGNMVQKVLVALIEMVFLSEAILFRRQLTALCRILEAIGLAGAEPADSLPLQVGATPTDMHASLCGEVLLAVTAVANVHDLPLVLSWEHASGGGQQNRGARLTASMLHTGGRFLRSRGAPCCVRSPHLWAFQMAAAEHSLQWGQGLVGRAWVSGLFEMSVDIQQFPFAKYPLVHHARMFGLKASCAIRMNSTLPGAGGSNSLSSPTSCIGGGNNDGTAGGCGGAGNAHVGGGDAAASDFVLEFFLPPHITTSDQLKPLMVSILGCLQKHCTNLRPAAASLLGGAEDGHVTYGGSVPPQAQAVQGQAPSQAQDAARHGGPEGAEGHGMELQRSSGELSRTQGAPGGAAGLYGDPMQLLGGGAGGWGGLGDHGSGNDNNNNSGNGSAGGVTAMEGGGPRGPGWGASGLLWTVRGRSAVAADSAAVGGGGQGGGTTTTASLKGGGGIKKGGGGSGGGNNISSEAIIEIGLLQQHFGYSLKDAAKKLGVCGTTLKRICRQYGIQRWPRRKINKLNRSLKNLQGEIARMNFADSSSVTAAGVGADCGGDGEGGADALPLLPSMLLSQLATRQSLSSGGDGGQQDNGNNGSNATNGSNGVIPHALALGAAAGAARRGASNIVRAMTDAAKNAAAVASVTGMAGSNNSGGPSKASAIVGFCDADKDILGARAGNGNAVGNAATAGGGGGHRRASSGGGNNTGGVGASVAMSPGGDEGSLYARSILLDPAVGSVAFGAGNASGLVRGMKAEGMNGMGGGKQGGGDGGVMRDMLGGSSMLMGAGFVTLRGQGGRGPDGGSGGGGGSLADRQCHVAHMQQMLAPSGAGGDHGGNHHSQFIPSPMSLGGMDMGGGAYGGHHHGGSQGSTDLCNGARGVDSHLVAQHGGNLVGAILGLSHDSGEDLMALSGGRGGILADGTGNGPTTSNGNSSGSGKGHKQVARCSDGIEDFGVTDGGMFPSLSSHSQLHTGGKDAGAGDSNNFLSSGLKSSSCGNGAKNNSSSSKQLSLQHHSALNNGGIGDGNGSSNNPPSSPGSLANHHLFAGIPVGSGMADVVMLDDGAPGGGGVDAVGGLCGMRDDDGMWRMLAGDVGGGGGGSGALGGVGGVGGLGMGGLGGIGGASGLCNSSWLNPNGGGGSAAERAAVESQQYVGLREHGSHAALEALLLQNQDDEFYDVTAANMSRMLAGGGGGGGDVGLDGWGVRGRGSRRAARGSSPVAAVARQGITLSLHC
eukprot:jgi/Mesvir1/11205/Mv10249-RA.1